MKRERTVLENEYAYNMLTALTVRIQWANCTKQCDLETVAGGQVSTLAERKPEGYIAGHPSSPRYHGRWGREGTTLEQG